MCALNGDTRAIFHHLVHSLGVLLYCSIIILNLKYKKGIKDAGGNFTFISLTTMDKDLLLVNVYGPNRDSPEFYDKMEDHVIEMGL